MNKLILTALGMVAALSAYAQGTFNASNNYIPTGGSAKAFVLGLDGKALAKANGKVEILAKDGTVLSPNGSSGVSLTLDGLFFINGLIVPNVATGGSADITVRAWDVTTGATYDAATTRGSVAVSVTSLGGGTTPPATFAGNSNFTGLQLQGTVVPEPTTVALAALGVAGLFVAARRKN